MVIKRASHLCDPGSTLARVVCGLSFSRSQSESEGFSPGTPVFLPPQNRLPAYSGCGAVLRGHTWVVFRGRSPSRQHNSFGPTSLSYAVSNSVSDCEKGRLAGQVSPFKVGWNNGVEKRNHNIFQNEKEMGQNNLRKIAADKLKDKWR